MALHGSFPEVQPDQSEGRAILWDLDGTILDPNGSIRASIDYAVTQHGHEPFQEEDRTLIGQDLRTILAMKDSQPKAIDAMVEAFRDHYTARGWRMARFFPGMRELIEAIHEAGWQQAIVTTKGEGEAVHLLDQLGFRHAFNTIVGDDDVRPIKPDPAPVEAACGRLGFQPDVDSAIMIGDTTFDIGAGLAAGASTVGVLWGHGSRSTFESAGAHHVVSSPEQLRECLIAWCLR